ncbi:MAG TPA: hypothetical protein VNE82_10385 [Candidatus Binataceae bacterium]|nr:hypothetical protein [Candidatus Binataceae bacterium]
MNISIIPGDASLGERFPEALGPVLYDAPRAALKSYVQSHESPSSVLVLDASPT